MTIKPEVPKGFFAGIPMPTPPAPTKRENPLDAVMMADDCDGDAFCGCGRVYPHRASAKRLRRKQQETKVDRVKCKRCDMEVLEVATTDGGKTWVHVMLNGMWMTTNRDHYAEPAVFPLYIYLHQTRAWERHESTTAEMRDYLRAVWRSAGHATAVSR